MRGSTSQPKRLGKYEVSETLAVGNIQRREISHAMRKPSSMAATGSLPYTVLADVKDVTHPCQATVSGVWLDRDRAWAALRFHFPRIGRFEDRVPFALHVDSSYHHDDGAEHENNYNHSRHNFLRTGKGIGDRPRS